MLRDVCEQELPFNRDDNNKSDWQVRLRDGMNGLVLAMGYMLMDAAIYVRYFARARTHTHTHTHTQNQTVVVTPGSLVTIAALKSVLSTKAKRVTSTANATRRFVNLRVDPHKQQLSHS